MFRGRRSATAPSKFMRWLDQLDREGNKLPVHPGVVLGDVKAKFAFAHGNFVADRPLGQQINGYMKMLGIGAAQGIDGIGSLMATIPTGFISKMADKAATDSAPRDPLLLRLRAAAVKQALEVNHKFATPANRPSSPGVHRLETDKCPKNSGLFSRSRLRRASRGTSPSSRTPVVANQHDDGRALFTGRRGRPGRWRPIVGTSYLSPQLALFGRSFYLYSTWKQRVQSWETLYGSSDSEQVAPPSPLSAFAPAERAVGFMRFIGVIRVGPEGLRLSSPKYSNLQRLSLLMRAESVGPAARYLRSRNPERWRRSSGFSEREAEGQD